MHCVPRLSLGTSLPYTLRLKPQALHLKPHRTFAASQALSTRIMLPDMIL